MVVELTFDMETDNLHITKILHKFHSKDENNRTHDRMKILSISIENLDIYATHVTFEKNTPINTTTNSLVASETLEGGKGILHERGRDIRETLFWQVDECKKSSNQTMTPIEG